MRVWCLPLAMATAGCPGDLPRVTDVDDLRVLAIRADPPEILLDAPAPTHWELEALVVDPRGGEVDYTWTFCPVESSRACLDWEDRLADAQAPLRGALAAMHEDTLSGTAPPLNELSPVPDIYWWSQRGSWRHAVANFAVDAPADLYTHHLLSTALGGGLGAWPSAILELRAGGDELRVQKRVVLGIEDLRTAAAAIAAEFGYRVCAAGITPEEDPGCILIRDRIPNRNPEFSDVQIARDDSALAPFHSIEIAIPGDVAGPVVMRAGEVVRIKPIFGGTSSEPYQIIKADIDTQELYVQDAVEDISVSWFVSAGDIQDPLTWPKFTKTLDTVYTAPSRPPVETEGRATVWMVARDQRGGIAWMSVEFIVTP